MGLGPKKHLTVCTVCTYYRDRVYPLLKLTVCVLAVASQVVEGQSGDTATDIATGTEVQQVTLPFLIHG